MGQEINFDYRDTAGKVYKDREIWAATLLGGVLAAGYMVAANYKTFGETDKARKTWLVSGAATAFLFYISFFAPYIDRLPNSAFAFIWASIVFVVVRIYQGEKIASHIRAGGQIQSWWKTIGVSLVGLAITVAAFVGVSYAIDAVKNANLTTKTYGTLKHDIAFDKNNISEAEADKLAEGFRQTGFFDDKIQKSVDAKKIGDNYEITVYCGDAIRNNSEAVGYFRDLRSEMQKLFPDNKIIFNLVISTPDNIVNRLE